MPSLRRRLIAGLVFGFLVALGVAFLGDIRQVTAHLASFAWGLLPLILACTLFNYLLRFVKWHLYLREIGAHTVGWAESARLFVAGFPLAVTPGKIGEALKGVWVNQRTGIPTARAIPVVLAERISDGLAVLILSTFGVVAYPAYWPAFAAVLGLLLGGVLLTQIRPAALAVLGWLEGLPILRRGISHLRAFYEGAYVLFRPRITFLAVGLGTVAWLGEGVAMYLVLRGLGVTPGWQTFTLSVFTLSFSTVVGAVSALPGGLGAAEAGIAGMLGLVMGLPGETAAAATLLIRFATLWFGVSLGLIVWSFSRGLLSNSTSAGPPQTGT
jgi:uncharacterized membrane protein YbhN (UPF0104 family)